LFVFLERWSWSLELGLELEQLELVQLDGVAAAAVATLDSYV